MRSSTLYAVSFLLHGAGWLVAGGIEAKSTRAATAIQVTEVKKKKPPPAKVEEKKPPPEKAKPRVMKAAAAEPLPEIEAAPKAPLEALPDFGLTLSGGVGGDGIAIPAGPVTNTASSLKPAAQRPVKRTLSPVAAAAPVADGCDEPPIKPKPLNVPQPAFTEAARAANVEGKVRVELTVDENGRVVEVRVLQGLGYGLDEAALAAARAATFEPALRCGKATRATFTISMRFTGA